MWIKASDSFSNGNCVEVKRGADGTVLVRNSRDPDGPQLTYDAQSWRQMLIAIKTGGLDHTLTSVGEIKMDSPGSREWLLFTHDEWAGVPGRREKRRVRPPRAGGGLMPFRAVAGLLLSAEGLALLVFAGLPWLGLAVAVGSSWWRTPVPGDRRPARSVVRCTLREGPHTGVRPGGRDLR
jgi:Domain of unknown function (DUF397)